MLTTFLCFLPIHPLTSFPFHFFIFHFLHTFARFTIFNSAVLVLSYFIMLIFRARVTLTNSRLNQIIKCHSRVLKWEEAKEPWNSSLLFSKAKKQCRKANGIKLTVTIVIERFTSLRSIYCQFGRQRFCWLKFNLQFLLFCFLLFSIKSVCCYFFNCDISTHKR